MFVSIKKMFSRHVSQDILAVTSSLTVMLYAITGIIKNEITLDIILFYDLNKGLSSFIYGIIFDYNSTIYLKRHNPILFNF